MGGGNYATNPLVPSQFLRTKDDVDPHSQMEPGVTSFRFAA